MAKAPGDAFSAAHDEEMESDEVKERIHTFLGEFRIIVPGLGAFLGFQLSTAFQQSFQEMPAHARSVNFLGILATTFSLTFLLLPAAYHRFARKLDETEAFLRLAQRSGRIAFALLAITLSTSVYLQALKTYGDIVLAASIAAGMALAFGIIWWIVPMARLRKRASSRDA